ncbi:SCO-spondin-like isoform X2 [Actinia tenebrosa]|uniref:SCO-spondin-like isoform X2 n=1 Tax=Actinia tenebrosa TaxID=6105 RepID=A0A6P8IW89_ACTTE|nr:SCO-spondin-like isoform X2 [Actinia tenebrosa]
MLDGLRLTFICIILEIILIILGMAKTEFIHLGCFEDSMGQRGLPIFLGYVASIQECADKVAKENFVVFGLQLRTECWSGPNGKETYDRNGPSDRCINGTGNDLAFNAYKHLPVNGSWSIWTPWEACSVTCGGGSQSRNRTCSNPPPSFGGLDCTGVNKETRKCGTKYCPACRSIIYEPIADPNKILTNHGIEVHMTESDQMCRIKCYLNYDCVSYNLGPSPTPGMMVCQLNDADRYQHPQDYQERPGYSYRGIENACRSNPCVANTTCQAGFGEEQYRCV